MSDKKPWEQFASTQPQDTEQKPWESFSSQTKPKESERKALSDIGNSIASGAAAAGRGILGLSDLVTGSNSIQNTKNLGLDIKSSEQAWKDNLSEKAKQEEQAWNNTQGFVDTLKYGATHPFAVANKVAESLPAMAVSGGMGGGIVKGTIGGAIGEGMQQAGSSYADAIEKNNGNTPTDNDAGAAFGSGVTTATISALSGGLAKKLGIGDIDTAIANRVAGEAATSARPLGLGAYAKNIGKGIITEGALEELPQSATETMWQNYADGNPIMEGVPEAAAQGLITGGLMGGAFNAANLPTFNESQNNQGNQDGQGQSSGPMPEVLPPDGSNGLPNNVQPNTFDGSYRDLTPSNAPQLTNEPQPEGAPASSNNTPSSETPTPNGLGLNLLQLNNTTSETPEVQAGNLSPSQELGIDPNQGGLSSAAAVAVDTGASPITAELQRQATQSQPNEQANWLNGIASPTTQNQNEAPQLGYSPRENTDTPPAQQAQVADLWNSQEPQQRMAILGGIYGNEDMARQNALASFDRLPKPAQQQIADIAVQNGAVSEDNNTQSSNGQTTQTAPQAPLTALAQDIAPISQANAAPAIEPILGRDGKNKWFATQNKADEFIQKKSLGDNYTIEQTGKMRYEIVPKVQPQAEQTAQPNTEPSSKVDDQWLSNFTNQMLQDKQLSSQLSNPSNSDELTFGEFSRKFDENLAKNFTNSTDNANEQSLLQNKNDNEIAKQQAYQLAKAQINQNQQLGEQPQLPQSSINAPVTQQQKRQLVIDSFNINSIDNSQPNAFQQRAKHTVNTIKQQAPDLYEQAKQLADKAEVATNKNNGRTAHYLTFANDDAYRSDPFLGKKPSKDEIMVEALMHVTRDNAPMPPTTNNTEATQPKLYGKESYIQTGSERQPTRVAVVEADSLAPDDKNTDNQFRDRTRAASQMQIDSIANNLDPRQLTDSTTMATGAPTLANDGKTIIAGNGRTKAIKQAYAQGKGAEYKQSLIEQAQSLGIDPQQIAGMKNPVLVKEFANPVDVKKMAIESNATGGLAMSAKEQARADSALLPDVSMLASDDKGNINLSRNAPVFRKFISSLPVESQASMLDKDGLLSKEGLSRLQNAVLYKAYGDSKAFDDMVENTDVDVKNAVNGLTQVAPKIAQAKESINQGTRYDADISDDITSALSMLQQVRKNEMSVSDYLAQMGLFDDGLSPIAKEFIQYIDANIRSAKAIADLLSAYYDNLDSLGNPNQQDLLGGKPNTDKQSLFKQALAQVQNAKQPKQTTADLFAEPTASDAGQPANQTDNAAKQRPNQGEGDAAGVGANESQVAPKTENELAQYFANKLSPNLSVAEIEDAIRDEIYLESRFNNPAVLDIAESEATYTAFAQKIKDRLSNQPSIPQKLSGGLTYIGENKDGTPLYEDDEGYRVQQVTNGLRNKETSTYTSKGIRPERRTDEFLTAEELKDRQSSQPKQTKVYGEYITKADGSTYQVGNIRTDENGKVERVQIKEITAKDGKIRGGKFQYFSIESLNKQFPNIEFDQKGNLLDSEKTTAPKDKKGMFDGVVNEQAIKNADRQTLEAVNAMFEKKDEKPNTKDAIEKIQAEKKAAKKDKEKFADNKVFTADKVAAARARMKSKLSQINSGIDPEMVMDGITITSAYVESGIRKFGDYANAMIEDFGDSIKPYLLSFWESTRHYPSGVDVSGMTSVEDSKKEFDALIAKSDNEANSQQDNTDDNSLRGTSDGRASTTTATGETSQGTLARVSTDDVSPVSKTGGTTGQAQPSSRTSVSSDGTTGRSGAQSERSAGNRPAAVYPATTRDERVTPEPTQAVTADNTATDYPIAPPQTQGNSQDFTISEDDEVGKGGLKTKFKQNLEAIKLLKQLQSENRQATKDEQKVLTKWVGWGGLKAAFRRGDGSTVNGWAKEVEQLEAMLTPDELDAALNSTIAAHYTEPKIVKAMWKAVEKLGFNGGRVLEPSIGSGIFLGMLPASLRKSTAFYGTELDTITGGLAQQLYPTAAIKVMGFQDYSLQDGFFKVAIGNPPFANIKITDLERKHLNGLSLHNYFFAKSLDALEDNGVLAMVVTSRLLDGADLKTRNYLFDNAELLMAVRLPNNAFKENANTDVTTDIIFLRKRSEAERANGTTNDFDYRGVGKFTDKNGDVVPLNNYFVKNPDHMLGEFGNFGSMYARGTDRIETALVAPKGQKTLDLLNKVLDKLPTGVITPRNKSDALIVESMVKDIPDVKVGSMFEQDGNIYERTPDSMGDRQAVAVELPSQKAVERVKGLIGLRTLLADVRQMQLSSNTDETVLEQRRDELNKAYDQFVKEHGHINSDANKRLFKEDPSWSQLSALEDNYDKGVSAAVSKNTGEPVKKPSAKKAAILERRTQYPFAEVTQVSSAKDGMIETLNSVGRLDLARISQLYGKNQYEVVKELGDLIYQDPVQGWVTADNYLSGNVKAKLAQAREAMATQGGELFERNVKALEKVQPQDIEAVDIEVRPGAHWIPANHITDFLKDVLGATGLQGVPIYSKFDNDWTLPKFSESAEAGTQFGTSRKSVRDIVTAAMNGKQITVYDQIDRDTRVVNQEATNDANQKVEAVKRAWNDWIWMDDNRRDELAGLYNDIFNTDINQTYDGSHLKLLGKVDDNVIDLRPTQKNAIWRITQNPTTLLDHVVGAGKTFTMVAAAMELRRMGLASKPMIVVPNHLVSQWGKEFIQLYPNANILVATKKDFEATNRKRLVARIANGDWDAVIVAHSSFGKIAVSPKFEAEFIKQQIQEISDAIEQARQEAGKSSNARDLANRKLKLEEKYKKLTASENRDTDNLHWDELGVDALMLDEAHEFKNLAYTTSSMNRVAGLGNQAGSQKAMDLFMKIQQLKQNPSSRIVFATGTPISNSMAEMYTMQRYLDMERMQNQGISGFDAWAKTFGEVINDWELSASGKYQMKSRFAKFVNMPELMQSYLGFADVINRDDINDSLRSQGKKLPVPKIKGGAPQNTVVERSDEQADFIGVPRMRDGREIYDEYTLIYRAEHLPKGQDAKKKGADNMLKIMGEARKAALDMRILDPNAPDFAGSKINVAVGNIMRIWRDTAADKGTQLVFCDLSTPKGSNNKEQAKLNELVRLADEGNEDAIAQLEKYTPDELDAIMNVNSFSVYDDIKQKLINQGIPENEIAFIHDANTELQKDELFSKVRSGRVRVLLGSTSKMGAGTNVQTRLVALHHMDAPWRPSDLEQREGRIIRQGNELYAKDPENFEVEIHRYATEQTMDAMQWQIIENKAKFIEQVRKGDIKTRVIEDIEGEAANAGAMKAAASGNPLILEEMALKKQLNDLDSDKTRHDREQHRIKATIKRTKDSIESLENEQSRFTTLSQAKTPAEFDITVNGKNYKQGQEGARTDAGKAIISQAIKASMSKNKLTVGQYGDFTIYAAANPTNRDSAIISLGYQGESIAIEVKHNDPAGGIITKLINRIKEIPDKLQQFKTDLEKSIKAIPKLESQLKPWGKEAELDDIRRKHTEVMDALKPKKEEQAQPTDKPQYSKRELLAPNGKPSNLTPEQYAQVRTKEFKAWFGDWENDPDNASKIVDDNGEPLVVYHGTNADEKFYTFEYGHQGAIDYHQSNAFLFTPDEYASDTYSSTGEDTMRVFLNAKNIFDFENNEQLQELNDVIENDDLYDDNGVKLPVFDNTQNIWEQIIEYAKPYKFRGLENDLLNAVFDWAKERGYDGVKLQDADRDNPEYITFGVFNPNQIKSATNNTGAFDANSNDIRHSKSTNSLTSTTKAQVIKTLSNKFSKATIDKLIADGNLEIIDYAEAKRRNQNTPSNADGYYFDGKAVLIADNLSPDMIIPTFLHELGGHGGLQTLMSDKAYRSLMKEFDRMVSEGNQLAKDAKAFADATSPNEEVAQDEYLPYLISLAAKAQGNSKVKSMLNRIVMAVKSFMRDKFGVSFKVTPTDIVALAEKMVQQRAIESQNKAMHNLASQFSKQTPQTEIDQVRKQYEGTDQWMKAPNGKPTNLTEKQWLQVRTPSFKAWFGDWENDPDNASKFVNEKTGEPLVLYHGSPEAGFSEFNGGQNDSIHFTNDIEMAAQYSGVLSRATIDNDLEEAGNYHVFINSKNPFIIDWNYQDWNYAPNIYYVEEEGKQTLQAIDDEDAFMEEHPNAEIRDTRIGSIDSLIHEAVNFGYDGVLAKHLASFGRFVDLDFAPGAETHEYVVTDPNQIKSATDNIGTFNPESDDIRYSQMGGSQAQQNKLTKALTEFFKNPLSFIKTASDNKVTDNLGKALALLGRRQLVDIYKKDLPPIKEYSDIVEQMDADSNEKAYEADKLVKEWGKLKDELPLAELMHDATLKGIDPAEAYQTGDDRAIYQQLRRRYDALSPDAKRIYKQARDDYKAQQRSVFEAIKGRIQRTDMSAPRQAELIRKMEQGFFFGQKVYFPLARFGNYVVAVKDTNGNIVSVSRAETQAQANQLRKELIAQYPNDKVGRVMLDKEFVSSRDGVTRGFMSDLFDAVDKLNISSQERAEFEDTLGQLYLNSLPDISFAKSGIHRKGTAGFSQNARRAYAQHMSRGSHYIAKMRHSDVLQAKLDEMQDYVKAQGEADPNYDQPKMQRVVDEMEKRHESLMNNHTSGWSGLATSVGFMWYMGLSPASALVNLSQTALVAYPIMGAKWGFSKAGKALIDASIEASKSLNNMTSVLSGDEKTAFDEAVKRGVIDMTQAHDLAGVARGEDDSVMWKIRKPMELASFMFHQAEKFNRQVTFVASYRLARQAGANHKQAIEQASDATYEGHFSYAASNRPRIMQGDWARVFLLFKQYGQNMVYTLTRNAYLSAKGDKQAMKTLAGILALHGTFAGVLGLPLATTLLGFASALGGDDDEPWNAEIALRNYLAELLGDGASEVISKGLPRALGIDLSSRVGLDSLILPRMQEGLEGQRAGENTLAAFAGPVFGIGVNAMAGISDIQNGNTLIGTEKLLPKAVRDLVKTYRYATEGIIDKTGVEIMPQENISLSDISQQALGFRSGKIAQAQEGKSAIYKMDKEIGSKRQRLMNRYAKAYMSGDAVAADKAWQDIKRFNAGIGKDYPKLKITKPKLMQSIKQRRRRIEDADDGIYLPSSREASRQYGSFATE